MWYALGAGDHGGTDADIGHVQGAGSQRLNHRRPRRKPGELQVEPCILDPSLAFHHEELGHGHDGDIAHPQRHRAGFGGGGGDGKRQKYQKQGR